MHGLPEHRDGGAEIHTEKQRKVGNRYFGAAVKRKKISSTTRRGNCSRRPTLLICCLRLVRSHLSISNIWRFLRASILLASEAQVNWAPSGLQLPLRTQIGRASCRE